MEERCICCGDIIPAGLQVCPACMAKYSDPPPSITEIYDKKTWDWFEEHPENETTVEQCEECGLFYKPILGHICRAIRKEKKK